MCPKESDLPSEEVAKKEFDDYEMPAYDKKSMKEIRKKIDSNGYKAIEEVEQHQEFLEDMANRLKMIIQGERGMGATEWESDRQLNEIQSLYFELEQLRRKFDQNK